MLLVLMWILIALSVSAAGAYVFFKRRSSDSSDSSGDAGDADTTDATVDDTTDDADTTDDNTDDVVVDDADAVDTSADSAGASATTTTSSSDTHTIQVVVRSRTTKEVIKIFANWNDGKGDTLLFYGTVGLSDVTKTFRGPSVPKTVTIGFYNDASGRDVIVSKLTYNGIELRPYFVVGDTASSKISLIKAGNLNWERLYSFDVTKAIATAKFTSLFRA